MSLFKFMINSIIFVEITLALSRTNLPVLHYQVNNAKDAKAFVSLLKSIFDKNTGIVNSFEELELQRFPLEPSRYVFKATTSKSGEESSSGSSESSKQSVSMETDLVMPQEENILRSKITHKSKNSDDDDDDGETDDSSEEEVAKKRLHNVKPSQTIKGEKKKEKKKKHDESETEESSSTSRERKKIKPKEKNYRSLSFMLRSCNTRALKICKRACRRSVKNACASYTCQKKMKKGLRRSCKKACKHHMKEENSSDEDEFDFK